MARFSIRPAAAQMRASSEASTQEKTSPRGGLVIDQLTDGNAANGEADVVVATYHEGGQVASPITVAKTLCIRANVVCIIQSPCVIYQFARTMPVP